MHTVYESENLLDCSNFMLRSKESIEDFLQLSDIKEENEDTYLNYNIECALSKSMEDEGGMGRKDTSFRSRRETINNESGMEGELHKKYKYGVSDPISLNYPTEEDLRKGNDVVELLKSYNLYETEHALKKRERVLGMINKLFHEFVVEISISQGINEEDAKHIHGNLYTFGSYRLGVITPNSDIDCIFLAPQNITREIFFNEFYLKLQQDKNVRKLQALPETYTPIIQFMYDDVDIDLLLATLPYRTLKDCYYSLDNDYILKNLDEVTVRSLNGIRVADLILASVPHKDHFRNTLRYIKLWAKSRGIYSNILGFLGGISWALLTAKICQLYPNYNVSQLICKFFRVYSIWNWKYPVLIQNINKYNNVDGLRNFSVWDPEKNIKDKLHVMPIITPAFPCMNSTHNVTYCTRSILIDEFKRAHYIINYMEMNPGANVTFVMNQANGVVTPVSAPSSSTTSSSSNIWTNILQPLDLFGTYKHFLHIQIMATSELIYNSWKGWIESKIRLLFKKLETINELKIRPYPKFYVYQKDKFDYCSSFFIALVFFLKNVYDNTFNLSYAIRDFIDIVLNWPQKSKYPNSYKINISYQKKSQVLEFLASVTSGVTSGVDGQQGKEPGGEDKPTDESGSPEGDEAMER
ncbi:poly(A) polymerase PAP, putative [Plasmodium knowlesi strain H]|uniref:Poly(A) polymerase n=3 Tax=Plasmodium knowlesi TaxID=5850 RepID=A0A5K1UTM1_PLAKH|nr:poly(A) polymerase PAP, putative [Plasmodium knowlesi strain H]OTN64554.1 putative Poly(A) polymerase PAP [Plasmodium knowlesi]CAA9989070.1 poly(A) polymerase PAP, putative [Plasmodium knowlesi strain H]SBO27282.1 poly(A) polymerase PAP, putative [Plasmodium knowlesi strain H]SBO28910.1 poly(A) polymerase PAP, putative [Plasmodium knowlesi strain H]VVS78544.1 poly(A) polymerase PAP, putative [Plasmodium knowlesi strain H]|eukprot:XP_002261419.1 putative poly(a) polymerase pap (poly(a) polymerase pap, putative [Plasmodium knowlesi strain H]